MQSYSQDLRDRVLWALDRGESPTAIARRLEVSRVWVYQVRGREQKTGQRTSFQIGGHRRSRMAEMESFALSMAKSLINATPFLGRVTGNVIFKQLGLSRGELDLFAGGPPCQGFSLQRRRG